MKKKAFTLAETLITLGIIGVIAAILGPLLNNMKPDANKAMYLKSYDALAHNVKKFAHNSSIYAPIYNDTTAGKTYQVSSYPLLDFHKPINPKFNDYKYSGTAKLGNLLEDALGGKHVQGHDIGNIATTFENGYNFTTNNGVQWWIQPCANPYTNAANNTVSFYNKVSIDINGNKGPNAYYSAANSNQTPDRFDFYITAAGNIIPADVFGQMYIDRRRNYTKKKEDSIISKYSAVGLTDPDFISQTRIELFEFAFKQDEDPDENNNNNNNDDDDDDDDTNIENPTNPGTDQQSNPGTENNNNDNDDACENRQGDGRCYHYGGSRDECINTYQGLWDGWGCYYD